MSKAEDDGSFGSAFEVSSVPEFLDLLKRTTEIANSNVHDPISLNFEIQGGDIAANNECDRSETFQKFAARRWMEEIFTDRQSNKELGFDYWSCALLFLNALDKYISRNSARFGSDEEAIFDFDLALFFAFKAGLAAGDPRSVLPDFRSELKKPSKLWQNLGERADGRVAKPDAQRRSENGRPRRRRLQSDFARRRPILRKRFSRRKLQIVGSQSPSRHSQNWYVL